MPCYHAWEPSQALGLRPGIKLPCGWCVGCRIDRSRQWAIRCMHEAQLHERNAYVTLTYDDAHAPENLSLNHRDWQLFAKRLRKALGPFKFYMCGEYGETFSRPHFHACLFGMDFDDKYLLPNTDSGCQLRGSATLDALWKNGYASVGAVTFQSAAYVARYVMKKITGDRAKSHYTVVTADGEIIERKPEYNAMSRGGRTGRGLSHSWYERFKKDVYPSDQVITRGFPNKPPRYYDELLRQENPELHTQIKARRAAAHQELPAGDNPRNPRRLEAAEKIQLAKLEKLKRTLK